MLRICCELNNNSTKNRIKGVWLSTSLSTTSRKAVQQIHSKSTTLRQFAQLVVQQILYDERFELNPSSYKNHLYPALFVRLPTKALYTPMRNIIGNYLHVLRPIRPFIPSGSVNCIWYQSRLRVNVLLLPTGTACG
jgi:hypothetical protein